MTATSTDDQGTVFTKVNGQDSLYVAANTKTWVAVLIPSEKKYGDPTITLLKATTLEAYFFFAANAPADPSLFVSNITKYLANTRTSYSNNLTMAWLYAVDSQPTDDNTLIIGYYVDTGGTIYTGQTFNYNPGDEFTDSNNQIATLRITNSTKVTPVPEEAPTTFQFQYNNTVNIVFEASNFGSASLLNQDLSIPFSGAGAGTTRFLLGLNLHKDIKAYDIKINYFYPRASDATPQCCYYPLLVTEDETKYAMSQVQLDPLDETNQKGLSSYFALTGETSTPNSGNSTTSLASYIPLNTGHPLNLIPKTSLTTDGTTENNLYPGATSARFVLSSPDAAGTLRSQLQIEGDFYIDAGPNQNKNLDENGQLDLLPGLSGTETLSFTPYSDNDGVIAGDWMSFLSRQAAYAPEFPPKEVSLASPGSNAPTLDPTYFTSWANVVSETSENIQYVSQPEGAALYAKSHGVSGSINGKPNLLGYFEPSVDMPQADFYVPMAPYLAIEAEQETVDFESQVLSKKRKSLITSFKPPAQATKSRAKRMLLAKAVSPGFTGSTTPQGLLAHVLDKGSWSLLNLGQNQVTNSSVPEYLYPIDQAPSDPAEYQLGFINLSQTLQTAFLTNQQFLVITQKDHLGQLFSKSGLQGGTTTSEATFNNKMSIEDWPFDLNVGTSNTYGDYNNVLIFKFCKGKLIDRVKNPNTWTEAGTFNTEGIDDPTFAYQNIVAISSWVQEYFADAQAAYEIGVSNPDTNQAILYENFIRIINDENWNGILALKVDIDLQEFPQQLKGLISGIDLTRFNAHHFGIEVNKVNATDDVKMEKNSSLFGLINYLDSAYEQQLLQGVNPEKPIPPGIGVDYQFKVLQLQVLFENTSIKFFQSKVQLTMNTLFADKVIGTNNPLGAGELNTVVLDGTYQDHDGTPVYIFENTDDNLFYFDSNVLTNVEVTKIQFDTLTTDPTATEILSRFTMWGYLNFAIMASSLKLKDDPTPTTTTLDAFSFGNSAGDNDQDITHGLNYSNLYIDMSFNLATPTVVAYGFDSSKIAFDSNQSTTRPISLYPNFALQINNLVSGTKDNTPSSLGYLTLGIPGINSAGVSDTWFGLEMTLNMGSPGELAASLDFNSSLLIAWSPGTKSDVDNYNTMIGIKLPGTNSNAKLLSLQGVLKLSIDTLKLEFIPDQTDTESGSYLMTLSNIALKFLGILKLPPGGSTNFLLFGNPNKGAISKSLGWYAAYNKTPSKS